MGEEVDYDSLPEHVDVSPVPEPPILREKKTITIEALADILDIHGHFHRPKCKTGTGFIFYQSRIVVTGGQKALMEQLVEDYGGSFRVVKMTKDGKRESYRWSISGTKAEALALKVEPFIELKKDQLKKLFTENR